MRDNEKYLFIARIISGCLKCDLGGGKVLLYKTPSRLSRYLAEEVYNDVLCEAELSGSYNEVDYLAFLFDKGFWDNTRETQLNGIAKDIEELKVGLFKSIFRSNEKLVIKKHLESAKAMYSKLHMERHQYDYITATGVAEMAKARYLVAASLYTMSGTKLYSDNELWTASDNILEDVAYIITEKRLTEEQLRLISRTDPWRTMWINKKSENSVFGLPAVDLNDEQRLLSVWSDVYDNIMQHPECPSDDIIADDDCLDGWMIVQKRQREVERGNINVSDNPKINQADEIFLPVDTLADAQKVHAMNDPTATMIKRKREALIQAKGVVSEVHMPDSQNKLRQIATQAFIEKTKG